MNAPEQPVPAAAPRTRRRFTTVVVPVAIVLTVLVAAGIVYWATVGSDDEPKGWARVEPESAAFGGGDSQTLMVSVAEHDGTTVAVGSEEWDRGETLPSTAAAWHSEDDDWQRVPHDEAVFGKAEEGSAALSVTEGGPGFVAVGVDRALDGRTTVAAVWTSADGTSWQRVPHDDVFGRRGEGDTQMRAVTAGDTGLVAVGDTEDGAAVWTSPDGRSWSRAHSENSRFETPGNASMHAVTSSDGGFVATGTEEFPGYGSVGAVWTSADGSRWQRAQHDEDQFGDGYSQIALSGVTAGPQGFIAVGDAAEHHDMGDSDAAVWTSPDGRSWSRVENRAGTFGTRENYGRAVSVTHDGDGFVAAGVLSDGAAPAQATVWTSPDGRQWKAHNDVRAFQHPQDAKSELWSVVPDDEGLIAVGSASATSEGRESRSAAVWTHR